MGGAIGPPTSWTKLREHWSSVLRRYNVNVFHMTDFENRFGEFRNWGNERRRLFLAELLSILDDTFLISIGTAVLVEDFQNLKPETREGLIDPWYLCFQMCLQEVAQVEFLVEEDLWDPKVRAVVFEQQLEFWRGPIIFAHMLERDFLAKGFGVLCVATKQACVKLHLADLIAYELRKHIENCFFDPGRPTRWPMRQLLKRPFIASCFDRRGRPIRTESSNMAFFRNTDTSDLDRAGKIVFRPNLQNQAIEDSDRDST